MRGKPPGTQLKQLDDVDGKWQKKLNKVASTIQSTQSPSEVENEQRKEIE